MTAVAHPATEAPGDGPPVPPLLGFTVAVTAARRSEELGAMLERRGARIVYAPALRIVPLADDDELQRATRRCLQSPVGFTVATTGIGFRGWMEAADGWGVGDDLRESLAAGTVLARGPKARGAVRAAGLVDAWSPPSESSSEVLEHLLSHDLEGRRVVVQQHGEPLPDVVDALRAAGADVVEVPVYRWAPPPDVTPLERLVESVAAGQVDAVTFTSAPAVAGFLSVAASAGRRAAVLDALRMGVTAACVGPVTAAPLEREGVPTLQPDRPRLGALVRRVERHLHDNQGRRLRVAGIELEIRGHLVVVGGTAVPLSPAPLAMLQALARRPGQVVARSALVQMLPGEGNDEHAVEVAVGRLRAALGEPRIVQTIVKRGYRLAYDPQTADECEPHST